MKTLVQITAQYYENYAFGNDDYDGVPSWKPKGEQIFKMYVDETDDFLYAEEHCIEAIKQLLEGESNKFCRYEYVGYEIIFHEPIELTGFDEKLEAILKAKYPKTENA